MAVLANPFSLILEDIPREETKKMSEEEPTYPGYLYDLNAKPVYASLEDATYAAELWEERYRTQHNKVHAMEDEIARLRAELRREEKA